MDALESAAAMIADDLIRMAKNDGVTNPDDVEVFVDPELGEVTEDMVRAAIRERWDREE